jgi:hypothetical protein
VTRVTPGVEGHNADAPAPRGQKKPIRFDLIVQVITVTRPVTRTAINPTARTGCRQVASPTRPRPPRLQGQAATAQGESRPGVRAAPTCSARDGREGSGVVGLRLVSFAEVMADAGLLFGRPSGGRTVRGLVHGCGGWRWGCFQVAGSAQCAPGHASRAGGDSQGGEEGRACHAPGRPRRVFGSAVCGYQRPVRSQAQGRCVPAR